MSYLSNDALKNRIVGISKGKGQQSKNKMLLFYYSLKLANLPFLADGALNELKYMEINYYNDIMNDLDNDVIDKDINFDDTINNDLKNNEIKLKILNKE